MRTKSRAAEHRRGDVTRPGNGIGNLLADVGSRHSDLMRLVESATDGIPVSRIERSAFRYASAVSRYRKAVLDLLPGIQLATSGRMEVSPRHRCQDVRWQAQLHVPNFAEVRSDD